MDMSLKLASSYFDMLKSLSDEAKLHLNKDAHRLHIKERS